MEYKHFSHEHNLSLYRVVEVEAVGAGQRCHGCQQPLRDSCNSSSVLGCRKCNFFLHEHCGNANRYVKHPSHRLHPLILLPTPTYCSGSFSCDACGAPGSTFSYCCALCELDLHLHCAFLPPSVTHNAHPHDLSLTFQGTRTGTDPQRCSVCTRLLSSRNWSYVCNRPEPHCRHFQAHTFCATAQVKPGLYQDDDAAAAAELEQVQNRPQHCSNSNDTIPVYPPPPEPQASSPVPAEAVLAEMFHQQLLLQMAQNLKHGTR
ncbi:uncharacterized protein LOC127264459 [Andrographis paniculata]|uniref:uncharacterized protein LOC127264459 n=1 Tax=Andrographis paniculata TaxID=175694 RepID=UPI0021E8EB49|nr:uncharacterized protein LOC127264459 [Andrographis paniculata]